MLVRANRVALLLIAAAVVCGCSSESPYNTPADPAKEAADIGAGAPRKKVGLGNRKTMKPPGGAPLKDLGNLQPSD